MGTKRNISPLTTNANFLSDLSETSISDSSNFFKNLVFCVNFFLQGLPRYEKFSFFLIFNSVDLFFIRFLSKRTYMELKSFEIF